MSLRRRYRGLELPGENRRPWLRLVRQGFRSKLTLVALASLTLGAVLWVRADHSDRVRRTRFEIDRLKSAATSFVVETGRCPSGIEELLAFRVRGRPFLTRTPRDAWNTPLYLACDNNEPTVVSAGPSGDFFADDQVL